MWFKRKAYGNKNVKVIGVYRIVEDRDVHLIEIEVQETPSKVNMDSFTQSIQGKPKDFWQVAYDEHYLNSDGTKVIGKMGSIPTDNESSTRVAFFMFYIKFNKPILSAYGEFRLMRPKNMPERLKNIIKYEFYH